MALYDKPVYAIDGREYSSINGFCKYLTKKHAAVSVSGVSSNRTIRVFDAENRVIAIYSISAPEIGKPMRATEI